MTTKLLYVVTGGYSATRVIDRLQSHRPVPDCGYRGRLDAPPVGSINYRIIAQLLLMCPLRFTSVLCAR